MAIGQQAKRLERQILQDTVIVSAAFAFKSPERFEVLQIHMVAFAKVLVRPLQPFKIISNDGSAQYYLPVKAVFIITSTRDPHIKHIA
jgi:hypothetical protein